jgi:hypothetical protein
MSTFRRLYNVAYGKVKATFSADEGPLVDEVERLRAPEPRTEPEEAQEAPVARPEPPKPRPRRL